MHKISQHHYQTFDEKCSPLSEYKMPHHISHEKLKELNKVSYQIF